MGQEREDPIRRAVQRVISVLAEEHSTVGAGGLFELAYPLVAADVPDAAPEEIKVAFAAVWGIAPVDRTLYEQVLAVCDRHAPGESETIGKCCNELSKPDVEAAWLLALVR